MAVYIPIYSYIHMYTIVNAPCLATSINSTSCDSRAPLLFYLQSFTLPQPQHSCTPCDTSNRTIRVRLYIIYLQLLVICIKATELRGSTRTCDRFSSRLNSRNGKKKCELIRRGAYRIRYQKRVIRFCPNFYTLSQKMKSKRVCSRRRCTNLSAIEIVLSWRSCPAYMRYFSILPCTRHHSLLERDNCQRK